MACFYFVRSLFSRCWTPAATSVKAIADHCRAVRLDFCFGEKWGDHREDVVHEMWEQIIMLPWIFFFNWEYTTCGEYIRLLSHYIYKSHCLWCGAQEDMVNTVTCLVIFLWRIISILDRIFVVCPRKIYVVVCVEVCINIYIVVSLQRKPCIGSYSRIPYKRFCNHL